MKRISVAAHTEEGHFARPWVWVMIDAFFLITAFFVCTFRVRLNEPVLPQTLAKDGPPASELVKTKNILRVHVSREAGVARYEYHSVRGTLEDLTQSLSGARQSGEVAVRVGYDSGVPFGDVLSVINACKRAGVREVGMTPSRF